MRTIPFSARRASAQRTPQPPQQRFYCATRYPSPFDYLLSSLHARSHAFPHTSRDACNTVAIPASSLVLAGPRRPALPLDFNVPTCFPPSLFLSRPLVYVSLFCILGAVESVMLSTASDIQFQFSFRLHLSEHCSRSLSYQPNRLLRR
jgi:hypothetical protein